MSKGQGKLLKKNQGTETKDKPRYVFKELTLVVQQKSVPQKYLFIAILCAKMSRVNKTLSGFAKETI